MQLDTWTWPDHYPAGCPPPSARFPNGSYYRITKSNPAIPGDFIPMTQENPLRAAKSMARGEDACLLAGLSVYADIDQAISISNQYPKLGRHIARVSMSDRDSKILPSRQRNSSHCTWWHIADFDPVGVSVIEVSL